MTKSVGMTKKLYIFNPETDYASASGSDIYTPSKAVGEMIRRMTLYPALWAEKGSMILSQIPAEEALAEAHPAILYAIKERELTVTDFRHISALLKGCAPQIRPWGWNRVLAHSLRRSGIDLANAPEENWEARLEASSRRRTIALNRLLAERLPEYRIPLPEEFTDAESLLDFRRLHGEAVYKDPWSSSGRGVLMTEGISDTKIAEWCSGVIRRHGFVMAETPADRITDCATLWKIENGEVRFLGFSMFETSGRGKYLGQIVPDEHGMQKMREKLPFLNDETLVRRILDAQKEFLATDLVSRNIPGYVGIDMLLERDGNLRPGIEINRRMTMGTAALLIGRMMPADIPLPPPFIRL